MKCCVSTDVGKWTNWLTFEPDSNYSPDARTGLLFPISHKSCYAEFYVGKIPLTARRYTSRGFKMVYLLSRRDSFVGGKCALHLSECPSSLYLWVGRLFRSSSVLTFCRYPFCPQFLHPPLSVDLSKGILRRIRNGFHRGWTFYVGGRLKRHQCYMTTKSCSYLMRMVCLGNDFSV